MAFSVWVNIGLILIVIYVVVIRKYVLARRKFKCLRCGHCCRLRVGLGKKDIAEIKKAGYQNFVDEKGELKKKNGYCIFLAVDSGIATCKIQEHKPNICRTFPLSRDFIGKKIDLRCRTCAGKLI